MGAFYVNHDASRGENDQTEDGDTSHADDNKVLPPFQCLGNFLMDETEDGNTSDDDDKDAVENAFQPPYCGPFKVPAEQMNDVLIPMTLGTKTQRPI
jgi:hypothetical protein